MKPAEKKLVIGLVVAAAIAMIIVFIVKGNWIAAGVIAAICIFMVWAIDADWPTRRD